MNLSTPIKGRWLFLDWPHEHWKELAGLSCHVDVEMLRSSGEEWEERIMDYAVKRRGKAAAEPEYLIVSSVPLAVGDWAWAVSESLVPGGAATVECSSLLELSAASLLARGGGAGLASQLGKAVASHRSPRGGGAGAWLVGEVGWVAAPPWKRRGACLVIVRMRKNVEAQARSLLRAMKDAACWRKFAAQQVQRGRKLRRIRWEVLPVLPADTPERVPGWLRNLAASRKRGVKSAPSQKTLNWWQARAAEIRARRPAVAEDFISTMSQPVRVGAGLSIVTLVAPGDVAQFREGGLTWKFPQRVAVTLVLAPGVQPTDLEGTGGAWRKNQPHIRYLKLSEVLPPEGFPDDPAAFLLALGNAVSPTERWVWLDPAAFQSRVEQGARLFVGKAWEQTSFGFPGDSLVNISSSEADWPRLARRCWIGTPATLATKTSVARLLKDWATEAQGAPLELYLPPWLERTGVSHRRCNLPAWGWKM